MSITNPTPFALRRIHKFELSNEQRKEHIPVDVVEYIDGKSPTFFAFPFALSYPSSDRFVGSGATLEAALAGCLTKIGTTSWDDLRASIEPEPSFTPTLSKPLEEMVELVLSIAREATMDSGHVFPERSLMKYLVTLNPKQRDALPQAFAHLVREGVFEERQGAHFLTARGRDVLYP